jgi:hypothetical protein
MNMERDMKRICIVVAIAASTMLLSACGGSFKEGYDKGSGKTSSTAVVAEPTQAQKNAFLKDVKNAPGTVGLAAYTDDTLVGWGHDVCLQKASLKLGDGTVDVIKNNPNDALKTRPEVWSAVVDSATKNLCAS